MMGRKKFLVTISLLFIAIAPHWRTVLLGELPLPEGYLALIAPELRNQLVPTPWSALWWDSIGQFWAWRTEAMRQLEDKLIPLWTNRVGCGFPFLANPQTQSLYPPFLFCQWLSELARKFGFGRETPLPLRSAKLMALLAFFHTLLALVGTYLLIRSFGTSRLASLAGASAYGLGSFQLSWALLPTLPATAAWFPLTLWFVRGFFKAISEKTANEFYLERSVANHAVGYGLACSLSLAMLLLAGHGQIAIYSLLAVFLFTLVEAITIRLFNLRVLLAIVGMFVLALVLASAQLLPTMELTPLTHRHGPPTWEGYQAFAKRGLTLADWATMVLPFLFGNPADGSYFGKESFADYCAYAGLGIFVLAGLGIWNCLKGWKRRYFSYYPELLHSCLLFLLGALLASGSTFNLPLYFLLPGFSQLGTPTRAVFICQLALGLAAAKALDEMEKIRVSKWALLAIAFLLPFTAVFGVGVWLNGWASEFEWRGWLALNAAQNMGVLLSLLAIALFAFQQASYRSPNSPLIRYGIVALLIGELLWFAAQQIPTARSSVVKHALQVAQEKLNKTVKGLNHRLPTYRILFIGWDWNLSRYPNSLLPPNSILLFEPPISDVRNYDSLLLRQHKAVMALFSNGNPCPLENGNLILMPNRWVDLNDAKKLAKIAGADGIVKAFGTELEGVKVFTASKSNSRNLSQTRIFVPHKVRYVMEVNTSLKELPDCPDDTALIVSKPKRHFGGVAYTRLVAEKGLFLRVRVELQRGIPVAPAWLVISDTFYPGWLAFQKIAGNGYKRLEIAIANGAFRACYLPHGSGEVVWVYFPSSFAIGAFLSCVGVFGLMCLAVLGLPVTSKPKGFSSRDLKFWRRG